jgi:hypothetical protein
MAKGLTTTKKKILASSGDQFHLLVVSILTPFLHPLIMSKRLGELDKLGIDAFSLNEESHDFEIVIQCKGFEKPKFGEDQLRQCIREISKYKEKGPPVKCYQLVLNRFVEGAEREALTTKLEELVLAKKAQKVELLDLNKLLQKIEDLAISRITEWANYSSQNLIAQYNQRLSDVDYIPEVPFDSGGVNSNPVQFIVQKIEELVGSYKQDQTSKYRPTFSILLTSSFGFGKTRALHTITSTLSAKGYTVILVPAGMLEATVFSNVSGLTHSILNILLPEDEEFEDLIIRILRDALKTKLIVSKNWILLLDGLDEHPSAYKTQSLYVLWQSIRDLGVPFVITARDELVDARPLEFSSQHGNQSSLGFERMQLTEWNDALILEFVKKYESRQASLPPPEFCKFKISLQNSGYKEIYGDIPERPLFLNMLSQDAWSGIEPSKKLHLLYENYFKRKFERDIHSSLEKFAVRRPSTAVDQLGSEEAYNRLVSMLTSLSRELLTTKLGKDPFIQKEFFTEDLLNRHLRKANLPEVLFEEILMHSLLLPAGRDRATRFRMARFAHKSFQDWFTARSLVNELEIDLDRLQPSIVRFLSNMRSETEAATD